jgi:O-antigen/teichoic acid export membrane protein
MIQKILRQFKNSEMLFNFKIIITGSLLSQILMAVASPVIFRLYSPEEFGVFALFISIVTVLLPVVSGGYNLAIVSAKKNQDGNDLFVLSIYATLIISAILLLFLFLFEEPIKIFLDAKKLSLWFYAIPIAVCLQSLNLIIADYANRFKNYKLIAKSSVIRSFFYIILVISFGYFGLSNYGLFFSELLASLIIIIFVIILYKKFFIQINFKNNRKLKFIIKKYINFPIFTVVPVILNNLATLMPIFFLTKFFSDLIVGYYFFAIKIIYYPISFISSAISTLHLKKTSELISQKKDVKPYFIKIMLILISFITIPAITVILFGPELFEFIFGKNWKIAGEFAQILMPAIALSFVVSSLSMIMISANKLAHYSIWSIISFLSTFVFFYFFSNNLEIKILLKYFVILNIGIYILYFTFIWNSIIKLKINR